MVRVQVRGAEVQVAGSGFLVLGERGIWGCSFLTFWLLERHPSAASPGDAPAYCVGGQDAQVCKRIGQAWSAEGRVYKSLTPFPSTAHNADLVHQTYADRRSRETQRAPSLWADNVAYQALPHRSARPARLDGVGGEAAFSRKSRPYACAGRGSKAIVRCHDGTIPARSAWPSPSPGVADEVQTPSRQQVQLDARLISRLQRPQVGADSRLVGDDARVLSVRLPVTAVRGCSVMNDAAGDVQEFLAVSGE